MKVSPREPYQLDKFEERGADFLYEEIETEYYRKVPREEIQIVQTLDAGQVTPLVQAKYKETPEELLYKEGYYQYRRVPATLETVTSQVVASIGNICEETEQIEVEETYLAMGAYTDVEIIPAEYGYVTLDVKLGELYDKLELKDVKIGELSVEQKVLPEKFTVLEGLDDVTDSNLLKYFIADADQVKDTLIRNCYVCPPDYERIGKYCYKRKEELKESYSYLALIKPATVKRIKKEQVFKTYKYKSIPNVDQVKKKCLEYTYTTRSSIKLVTNADVERVLVPSQYQEINLKKLVKQSEVEIVRDPSPSPITTIVTQTEGYVKEGPERILCVSPLTQKNKEMIYKKLTEKGVVSGPYTDAKFLKGVLQYQEDNGLKIGVIDLIFIELIGL